MAGRRQTWETWGLAARGQALVEQRFDAREALTDRVDSVAVGDDFSAKLANLGFQLGAELAGFALQLGAQLADVALDPADADRDQAEAGEGGGDQDRHCGRTRTVLETLRDRGGRVLVDAGLDKGSWKLGVEVAMGKVYQ